MNSSQPSWEPVYFVFFKKKHLSPYQRHYGPIPQLPSPGLLGTRIAGKPSLPIASPRYELLLLQSSGDTVLAMTILRIFCPVASPCTNFVFLQPGGMVHHGSLYHRTSGLRLPTDSTCLPPSNPKPAIHLRRYLLFTGQHNPKSLLDITRFSNFKRLLRSTAWALRFLYNCRHTVRKGGELTATELSDATCYWIGACQRQHFPEDLQAFRQAIPLPHSSSIRRFNPFLDSGLIHLGGRLQFANLTPHEKHPFLLHGKHGFTTLLILDTHRRLHHLGTRIILAELRSKFWILKGRQAIKSVIAKCLPCRKQRASPSQQIEAPLPLDRLRTTSPFSVTGIDFAGPLSVRQGNQLQKAYVVIFTCASVRAIHLELASDMTTATFLSTLQRFVGRRGVPNTIYSDNAKTFHASSDILSEIRASLSSTKVQGYLAHHGIHWKFIVERAARWGGWWERMIGSVKRCLRKTVGQQLLTSEELTTVLVGIEAALNSRPIVHDYSLDDIEPLTPAHFLVGKRLTHLPPEGSTIPANPLTREWKLRQRKIDDFWKRWTKEYLLDLRSYHTVKQPLHFPIKVGDIVMIHEDMRPRHLWKIGRISDIRVGRDDKPRTCVIQMPNRSRISRPIQLVIPLEITDDQGGEDVEK